MSANFIGTTGKDVKNRQPLSIWVYWTIFWNVRYLRVILWQDQKIREKCKKRIFPHAKMFMILILWDVREGKNYRREEIRRKQLLSLELERVGNQRSKWAHRVRVELQVRSRKDHRLRNKIFQSRRVRVFYI